jgi:hypothetical protein
MSTAQYRVQTMASTLQIPGVSYSAFEILQVALGQLALQATLVRTFVATLFSAS